VESLTKDPELENSTGQAPPLRVRRRHVRSTAADLLATPKSAGSRGTSKTRCPNRGHRATRGTLDAAGGSVQPTPAPLGAEVEARRARALITLVRPTAPPRRAEMPADWACAIGRHWMTKAARTTPPSRTTTLGGIRGTRKTYNATSECSAQNQTLQHRCSSDLSSQSRSALHMASIRLNAA